MKPYGRRPANGVPETLAGGAPADSRACTVAETRRLALGVAPLSAITFGWEPRVGMCA